MNPFYNLQSKSILFGAVLLFFFLANTNVVLGDDGDTTNVYVHDLVDMTWNGNYDQMGVFPDGSKTYRKITMFYTLGCSSAQCSDWDYTTQIFLVPDANDGTQNMELGRVITPYGGYMAGSTNGFSPNWNHTYTFDLTDFAPVLKNDMLIRAFYDGWSDGFSVSLRFEFIEGTPPREVKSIENLYHGRAGYSSWVNFDLNNMPFKSVMIPSDVLGARARVSITGHGFDNNTNCAEFCERSYSFDVGSTEVANVSMWRDDCGLNPIYPQGGTWLYNRADWCPGDKNTLHIHELSDHITAGASNNLNMDLQNYSWAGTQEPYYIYDVQMVYYGAANFTNDVEIVDILAPTNQDPYTRHNPICGQPKIKIRNSGSADATSITFRYGVEGGNHCEYTWTGNLAFMSETEIELPAPSWAGVDVNDPRFEVRVVTVNGATDEYASNDWMSSPFSLPPSYNVPLLVNITTNNAGFETGYEFTDSDGNVLKSRAAGTMSNNTLYRDTLYAPDGCYTFRLTDSGGDGLSWWANSGAGTGSIVMRNTNGFLIKSFQPDFGSEVYYQFAYGDLEAASPSTGCTLVATEEVDLVPSQLNILPNPNNGNFTLRLDGIQSNDAQLSVMDAMGRVLYLEVLSGITDKFIHNVALDNLAKGIYLVRLQVTGKELTRKIVVQ